MAGTNAVPSIHKISFCFDVPNISTLNHDGIWSPIVHVYNVPWRVLVCKEGERRDEALEVYLHCNEDSHVPNWSYAAHSRFKLLSFNREQDAVELILPPYVYSIDTSIFGDSPLIEWRDLFDETKEYVKDDTIRLEITLEMANPNDVLKSEMKLENIEKCCKKGALGIFRLTVLNIEKLLAIQSPYIVLRNIRLFFTVFKLGISLHSDTSDEFSYDVEMMVKLIPSNSSAEPVEQTKTIEMKKNYYLQMDQLISWNQLLGFQKGFISKNSIVIEIKLITATVEEAATNSRKRTTSGPSIEAKQRKLECAICLEGFEEQDISITNCGHLFCSDCIQDEIERNKQCPTCRTGVTLRQLKRAHLPL